jgi:hypothetical protein
MLIQIYSRSDDYRKRHAFGTIFKDIISYAESISGQMYVLYPVSSHRDPLIRAVYARRKNIQRKIQGPTPWHILSLIPLFLSYFLQSALLLLQPMCHTETGGLAKHQPLLYCMFPSANGTSYIVIFWGCMKYGGSRQGS